MNNFNFKKYVLVSVILIIIGVLFFWYTTQQKKFINGISPNAAKQINEILDWKKSLTPIQQKIGQDLLFAIMLSRGETLPGGLPAYAIRKPDTDGKIKVDIRANVTNTLLQQIKNINGEILYSSIQGKDVLARIPLIKLESLASWPDIYFIMTPPVAFTN